jgi:hypothetical protein
MGLPLIAKLSSSLEILAPEHGGTELMMRFDLREPEDDGR